MVTTDKLRLVHSKGRTPAFELTGDDDPAVPVALPKALASGATDLLGRDRRTLAAVFRGDPVRAVVHTMRTEPTWLAEVFDAMRLFIASDAEPRRRAICLGLCARTAGRPIEKDDVAHEARLLLDDLDDRRAFLRLAGVER